MQAPRFQADTYAFYLATSRSSQSVTDVLRDASNIINDPRRDERLEAHECKACFYVSGRCGGSAITHRQCGLCDTVMSFANTCTDAVCPDCARKHSLCRHCGGDIEMKVRRRKWPQQVSGEVAS